MIKLSLPLIAVTLVATTSIALADEKSDLIDQLDPYIRAPRYLEEEGANAESRFDPDAATCMQIVEKLQALGQDPNERFPGYMAETWRFKQAPALCQKYREYQLRILGGKAVEHVAPYLRQSDVDGSAAESLSLAQDCVKELDKLVADGLPKDAMIRLGHYGEIKVSEAQEGCAVVLANSAERHAKDMAELEARERAEAAMWAKLGVAGDRLHVIKIKQGTTIPPVAYFYIKGCEETSDPKKLAKAKVLREIFDNNDGLTISVVSHFFKGNKLLRQTNVTWSRGSMHAACK